MNAVKFDFVDGEVYKVVEPWMILQVPDAYEEDEYTKEEINKIIEKLGVTDHPVFMGPVIIPEGTELTKLPDSEACKAEKDPNWRELEFLLADTDVAIKIITRCPYTGSTIYDLLSPKEVV